MGGGQLHPGDHRRVDVLRPDPAAVVRHRHGLRHDPDHLRRVAMSTPVTPVLDVAIPVHHEQHTVAASVPGTGTWRQVSRFAAVGVVSTVIHLGLFASLAPSLVSTQAANLVALLVATVANTALNRRWTFGVRGAGRLRSQLQGLAVFGITWLLTAGALALLHAAVTNPSTAVATLV